MNLSFITFQHTNGKLAKFSTTLPTPTTKSKILKIIQQKTKKEA